MSTVQQTPQQKKKAKVQDAKLELIMAIYHKANYFDLLSFARKIGVFKNPLASTYPEIIHHLSDSENSETELQNSKH